MLKEIQIIVFIDFGVNGFIFIDKIFVKNHQLPLNPLLNPIILRIFNKEYAFSRAIIHKIINQLLIKDHLKKTFFLVTKLNENPIILRIL